MKKRQLKGYVLPTVYVLVITVLFISIAFLGSTLENTNEASDLTVSTIKEDTLPVVSEVEDQTEEDKFIKPYTSENVTISISYYDQLDSEEDQQKSLIYYENTYMPSTGVIYTSNEEFDVVAVYDGTVTNVSVDDILGNYIEITHNTNLRTIYYCLGEASVSINDTVIQGQTLAKSGTSNLTLDNSLLFEVYYNGFAIDPEEFYSMNPQELK